VTPDNFFNNFPDPVLSFSQNSAGSVFLVKANQSAIRIFGNELNNLIGDNIEAVESVFPKITTNISKVLSTNESVQDEIPWKRFRENGSNNAIKEFYFLTEFVRLDEHNIVLLAKDITVLKKTQDELQEYADLIIELVAEYSPLGIINLTKEGKITFANPTSTQFLGWLNEEVSVVEGRNIFDFPFVSEEPYLFNGIRDLLDGDPLVGVEFSLIIGNEDKILRAYGSPRYAPDGSLKGAILMYADITDLKRTEELLNRQKEELSDFAHQMAHDLKNHINNILGYSTLIQKNNEVGLLNKIAKHAKKMDGLLNRSLELADAGLIIDDKDTVDLNDVVETVAELTIPQKVKFSHDILPTVACDRIKTSQIFQNLFANAVIHGEPNQIDVRNVNGTNFTGIRLHIVNDGKPIPQDIRDNIFNRGFSTHDSGKGLGLYLVKKLVEAQGWTISLVSSETPTFQLSIPY
jgi:PAS domain S-box-containing protein